MVKLNEEEILHICEKCARIVNKKFRNSFELNELISVGCCHLMALPAEKIEQNLMYSEVYFCLMKYATKAMSNKNVFLEDYARIHKNLDCEQSEIIDIVEAWKKLSVDDQQLLFKYIIEGKTYLTLCEEYGKNNPMSMKLKIDKAKARLKNYLKDY